METIPITEVKPGDVILDYNGKLVEVSRQEIGIEHEDDCETIRIYHYNIEDTANRVFGVQSNKSACPNHVMVWSLDSTIELHHRHTTGELYWREKYGLNTSPKILDK